MSEPDGRGTQPTPRQVLYGLVAAGFHLVVGVLGWGSAGLAPAWWNWGLAVVWVVLAGYLLFRWRRTGVALALTIGEFVAWTIGAAILFS
jgi:hypothetical protein